MSGKPEEQEGLPAGEAGATDDSVTGDDGSRVVLAAGLSDRGLVRPRNEDAFLCDARRRLFLVADGMGGHAGGDQASAIAVRTLDDVLNHDCLARLAQADEAGVAAELAAALREANDAVLSAAARQPELLGMGCTIVVAVLVGCRVHVANLGDSRAYVVRGRQVTQLTEDHTWAAMLVSSQELTREEARQSPMRNRLTGFIGMAAIEPAHECAVLRDGDRLLLCSDGLWDEVSEPSIALIAGSHADPADSVRELIATANEAGGSDNITAVVVHIDQLDHDREDCHP